MFGACCLDVFNFLPTHGVSVKPLKVRLLAGEQKATDVPPAEPQMSGLPFFAKGEAEEAVSIWSAD